MRRCLLPMSALLVLMVLLGACAKGVPTPSPKEVVTETPTTIETPTVVSEPEEPLSLLVLEPQDETVVNTSRITVSGTTRSDAVVSINGAITYVDSQGSFTGEVNLDIGPNAIEVVTSDFYENEESVILTVIYAAALPLTVTEPLNESVVASQSVVVKGVTNADAVVSVNDDMVSVDVSGGFSAPVSLEEGPNFIEVVASDFDGNSSTVTIVVIYIP